MPLARLSACLLAAVVACAENAPSPPGDADALATGGTGGSNGGAGTDATAGAGGSSVAGGAAAGGAAGASSPHAGTSGSLSAGASGEAGGSTAGTTGTAGAGGDAGNAGTAGDAGFGSSAGAANAGSGGCAGLFCEDFEAAELDTTKWTLDVSGANTVTVQTTRVAHGTRAARIHYAGTRATWAFLHATLPAALATHHFGRAYVYLTPALPDRHTVLVTAGTEGFPTHKYLEVAGIGTQFQLTAVDLVAGAEDYRMGGTLPRDRWYCLEWEFDDAPDRAVVLVDGTETLHVSSFTVSGKSSAIVGGFRLLGVGLRAWGSGAVDPSYDLYYDDIVLGAARVGCL